ncbi:MAG: hypothetical protein V4505_17320 [Pseudomonadota bacterium]
MHIKNRLQDNLKEWAAFDAARPSLPGEHLLVAGAGLLLLASALRGGCRTTSTLQALAGGALLLRAASGRDGVCQFLSRTKSDAYTGQTGIPGVPDVPVERTL